mmetsp:Transcript_10791/g.20372  ORF Transcript_10791/g.20372 Transcript_10791/m.20372 type:complete len:341 (-) Transcript_10791:976-1998(-)
MLSREPIESNNISPLKSADFRAVHAQTLAHHCDADLVASGSQPVSHNWTRLVLLHVHLNQVYPAGKERHPGPQDKVDWLYFLALEDNHVLSLAAPAHKVALEVSHQDRQDLRVLPVLFGEALALGVPWGQLQELLALLASQLRQAIEFTSLEGGDGDWLHPRCKVARGLHEAVEPLLHCGELELQRLPRVEKARGVEETSLVDVRAPRRAHRRSLPHLLHHLDTKVHAASGEPPHPLHGQVQPLLLKAVKVLDQMLAIRPIEIFDDAGPEEVKLLVVQGHDLAEHGASELLPPYSQPFSHGRSKFPFFVFLDPQGRFPVPVALSRANPLKLRGVHEPSVI